MNIKKYLRQQAEKDAESLLTESDRQFSMQLAERVQQPVQQKPKTFRIKAFASAAAVLLVAVVLGVTLPLTLNKQPPVNDVHYKEENIVQTACTIDEVNYNAKYFQLDEAEDMSFQSYLKYDSVSGDKLFYSVTITTDISEFTLDVVVNEKYNYDFKLKDDLRNEQLTNYNINFFDKHTIDEETQYTGYVKINSEIVYIDYLQYIDLDDKAFFDQIESVLKVKN